MLELSEDSPASIYTNPDSPASLCTIPELPENRKVRFAFQDEIIENIYFEDFLVDDDIPYGKTN